MSAVGVRNSWEWTVVDTATNTTVLSSNTQTVNFSQNLANYTADTVFLVKLVGNSLKCGPSYPVFGRVGSVMVSHKI